MHNAINLWASVVPSLGKPEFAAAFHRVCEQLIECDISLAYVIPNRAAPRNAVTLCSETLDFSRISSSVTKFMSAGYLRDPLLHNYRRRVRPVFVKTIVESAPHVREADACDMFMHSVECALGRIGDDICYMGFCRPTQRPLTKAQFQTFRESASLMMRLVHRHDQISATYELAHELDNLKDFARDHAAQDRIAELLGNLVFKVAGLSPREAEICARTIMGYSVEAISLWDDVSTHTVATLKKRAYGKLGISSTNDLFNICMAAIGRPYLRAWPRTHWRPNNPQ